MKAMSHGFLALKTIERLEQAKIPELRDEADDLILWLRAHQEGVIKGAWYPDAVFKDMANSHVFKLAPDDSGQIKQFRLPSESMFYKMGKESPLHGKPWRVVDPADNLPERCEAWAHSIVDHLKIQQTEGERSPIASSGNHIALALFILSHYVADAHMPLHCDGRPLGKLHEAVESAWEHEVSRHFELDAHKTQFRCDAKGHPLWTTVDHTGSFLEEVEAGLSERPLSTTFGGEDNKYVKGYMRAICHYSYLMAYRFVPAQYDEKNIDMKHWQELPGSTLPFRQLSAVVFSDAIDAIARIWLRIWGRYHKWKH